MIQHEEREEQPVANDQIDEDVNCEGCRRGEEIIENISLNSTNFSYFQENDEIEDEEMS